jgi:hypothetical protein
MAATLGSRGAVWGRLLDCSASIQQEPPLRGNLPCVKRSEAHEPVGPEASDNGPFLVREFEVTERRLVEGLQRAQFL